MKRVLGCGILVMLLGMLWCVLPATAQEHRFQTRAKVWDAFWNSGEQGVREASRLTFFRPVGLMYPGTFTAQHPTEFIEYWGVRLWPWGGSGQTTTWSKESTATMPGLNTLILTTANGEKRVSEMKPNHVTPDIKTVAYDPSVEPEASIGYPKSSPLGPSMSNWWPGQVLPGGDHVVEIHNYRYSQYMDPDRDMFPESMLISRYATGNGLTVTRKAYTWSYPTYDDFEILEYTFENTGDSDGDGVADLNGGAGFQLNDTYIGLSTRFFIAQSATFRNVNAWYRTTRPTDLDDWYKYTEAPNYDGPSSGLGLKMWYAFDADNPLLPGDDLGKPYVAAEDAQYSRAPGLREEGELLAYQYVGLAPLAYTPGGANNAKSWAYDTGGDAQFVAPKEANQPVSVTWYNYRNNGDHDEPDTRNKTIDQIFNQLTTPGVQAQPTEPDGVFGVQTFGPYDLAPGEKARIVMVLVAAAPVEENIWGWAKKGIVEDLRSDKAFNNLVKHFNAARDAFDLNYDLPDPPPDVKVDLRITFDATVAMTWSAETDQALDPDYSGSEAKDVAGYRIYRSDFKIDDWKLVGEFSVGDSRYLKGNTYEFIDETSAAGFEYMYSVRSYDTGHSNWKGTGRSIPPLESGHSSPEQWVTGVLSAVPYVPPSDVADRLQRKVVAVPNPFKFDNVHSYGGSVIRFTSVPRKCQISIYTVAGELIGKIDHDDPLRGEATWDQTTAEYTLPASSGVYFFVVKSQVPGSEGQLQRGSFMVIK